MVGNVLRNVASFYFEKVVMYTIAFFSRIRQFVSVILIRDLSNHGGVAQWLEQRAHNLLVAGSSPATPTKFDFKSD